MNNVERTAGMIREAFDTAMSSGTRSTWAYQIAQALADGGLLMPDLPRPMQIIRTAQELEALDAGTYLVDTGGEIMTALGFIDTGDFPMDDTDILAVVATEDHVRAVRKALEDA